MVVHTASLARIERVRRRNVVRCGFGRVLSLCLVLLALPAARAAAQGRQPDWQGQVRKYCEASDWPSAMRVLEQQIARAPGDLDVKAWRARVLTWSGRLAEAQQEYLAILKLSPRDPDNWAGLASVYAREGKNEDALRALDTAVQLEPKRADLHAARARALRALGRRSEARAEFRQALILDPPSTEARVGLKSLRAEPKSELRVGNETDLLSYTAANEGNWASLATRWTPVWATSLGGGAYQRSGVLAAKFIGSATAHLPSLGAITAGGAVGHDNSVIPKSEAFFDLDRGWKTGEGTLLRGLELSYGQHWYWYQAARILALNGVAVIYLPREWSFSLAATGARSAFSGTRVEWRPSGSMRLGFPLATWRITQLSGNIFYAAGTENFALSDQIGAFASQTYGGGLRFRFSERQDITCVSSYQRRTQNRTDTYLGFSYGIHF
jgi:tetratricopeptide (TPR) repeat protein